MDLNKKLTILYNKRSPKEKGNTFDDYPPPLIVKNIHKLDEVYLI